MKMRTIIGITILFISINVNAQTKSEIEQFKKQGIGLEITEHKHIYTLEKKPTNEINFLFSGFFIVYKKLISSQDVESCVFEPSCSVYGAEAIRKNGIIPGLLATFDRLTRCHPYNADLYPIHPVTHKLYDPVEEK